MSIKNFQGVSTITRKDKGPAVVLCSRGNSYEKRLDKVAEYAVHNKIKNVVLLHCPEKKYSPKFVADIAKSAASLFQKINMQLVKDGNKELNFDLIITEGYLQDNLRTLINQGDISLVFVGMKMLDYRLSEIKKLKTAFFFLGNK